MAGQPPPGEPGPADGGLPAESALGLGSAPFGVYVHIPFCQTRCGYCDFNTYTVAELGSGVSRGSYADTVLHEVRLAGTVLTDGDALGTRIPPVSTIFFGGGTPTLLPAEHLGLIIKEVGEQVGLQEEVETTTEAYPETRTPANLGKLLEAGFTRVSSGMQSAVPHVLE